MARKNPRGSSKLSKQEKAELAAKQNAALDKVATDFAKQEDSYRIDLQSNKRAMKYLIVAVIFLIACIASWFIFLNIKSNGTEGKQSTCWKYEEAVEEAVSEYTASKKLLSNPTYLEDIDGFNMPTCPSGGTYTWNPVTGELECSEHGHYTDEFSEVKQSSSTTTTTQNTSK